MDKYELRIISWAGILIAIFLIAVLRAVSVYATDVPECVPYDETFTDPKVVELDDGIYQVYALAHMWNFEPPEIRLPVGAEVDFYLTSSDVVHGYQIADVGLNMMAVPGGVNKSTAKFNKPGVYQIICHEYCGSGHQHMQAEIIVNYPNE